MDDDAEIVAEFLVESHENLDQLDLDLVALEQDPGSRELLSSIFRTIHTIKGTTGFLGFHRLEQLTHAGESLLSRLRDGQLTLSEESADVLLRLVDAVRVLLRAVEDTGSDEGGSVDVAALTAAIEAQLEPAAPERAPEPEPAPVTPAPEPAPPRPSTLLQPVQPAQAEPASEPEPEPEAAPEPQQEAAPVPQQEATPEPVPDVPVVAVATPEPDPVPVEAVEEDDPKRRGVQDATVRVDVDLLDSLVRLVGELVLTRNQVLRRTDLNDDVELVRAAQRLDQVASELQEGVMKTRMQPIGQVWSKMPRIVRDLSHQLGRQVQLDMTGHETELDRTLLEALRGPLTHLVRNAIDHGIEPPEVRRALGKPESGRLQLKAVHESGQVVIEISDDGKGIDPAVITKVAIQRGVATAERLAAMDPRQVTALIFEPGFSTATEVTNVSGRGVGMDVVRTNLERIGGSVDVQSVLGQGTTCRVRIPLTLAIIPALVVEEGEERYAVPQVNLVELVHVEGNQVARDVEMVAGSPVLRLRGDLLPLLSLGQVLGHESATTPTSGDSLTVVVVQSDDVRFGLCVSAVQDVQEIVVKPLGRLLKPVGLYAGATIMGDGRVALILDVPGVAHSQGVAEVPVAKAEVVERGTEDTLAMLVLEVAPDRRAAVPLKEISRLEEFALDRVERAGRLEAVQYRDGILPLVRLAGALGLEASTPVDGRPLSVVVHEVGDRRIGLVIDRVLDVVETTVTPSGVGRRPGVRGSAVIGDRVTDLVDVDAVVALAGVDA